MKQGNSNGPGAGGMGIDLDALERDIQAAATAKRSVNNDPLAELARIMGQDDPFAGLDKARTAARPQITLNENAKVPSFDEFLNAQADKAPSQESVFDAFLDQPAFKQSSLTEEAAVSTPPKAGVAQEDDEQIAAALSEEFAMEELFLDDQNLRGALPAPEAKAVSSEASLDFEELLSAQLTSSAMDTQTDKLALPEATKTTQPPQFDDMLAEFESAMRDAGGERMLPSTMPSLTPVTIPPPPEALLASTAPVDHADAGFMNSGLSGTTLAGAAAGGAAVIAASTAEYGAEARAKRPRRGLMIAGGVIGVAVIGISVLLASGGSTKKPTGGQAPVIAANSAVTKERPANPGGVEVPNQDKEVLKAPTASSSPTDRVAPREEQPLDLKQAQAAAASQPAVRQIPGVVIIPPAGSNLPSTPTPAAAASTGSPSVAGNLPVARPVASVPITIAGQTPSVPAATPTPVSTPAPAPAAPVVPEPVAPIAAPKVVPPAPVQSAPAQPVAAQPAAPAEPRRVRAVAIRSDGETTPSRAQAQPRVVPAAPRPTPAPAAEAESGTGPLRITPQALRGTQRVASAAPATEQPSAPAASSPSPSGGSGFSVQLGAEGSQDAARAKFNRVKGQHSDVLGSQSANIRNAEVNGRTVYRIRVGNMTRDQAVSLCERLKANGGSCFVARN